MSGPSLTAMKIARFMILMDSIPRLRSLLPENAAADVERLLRVSGVVRSRDIDMMRKPVTQKLYVWAERLLGRGQLLWFGLRKRYVFDAVCAAIEAGATQLLVVGAGFDPLAVGIARRFPEMHCIEIDAPPTAHPKRNAIEHGGFALANLQVVPSDLARRTLADTLHDTLWRSDARSVIVAEGLLMYLRRSDVEALFAGLARMTGPGSRIVFTAVDADERGGPRLGTLDRSIRLTLRLFGEAMHWGVRPADLASFLAPLGWRVIDQPTTDTLRQRLLDPRGLHDEPLLAYEHVAVAEVSA